MSCQKMRMKDGTARKSKLIPVREILEHLQMDTQVLKLLPEFHALPRLPIWPVAPRRRAGLCLKNTIGSSRTVQQLMTALFDYISVGRSTHYAFYHWRPHLSSNCRIGLEQSAGVSPVVSVVASFPQQTENRTFCLVLQS